MWGQLSRKPTGGDSGSASVPEPIKTAIWPSAGYSRASDPRAAPRADPTDISASERSKEYVTPRFRACRRTGAPPDQSEAGFAGRTLAPAPRERPRRCRRELRPLLVFREQIPLLRRRESALRRGGTAARDRHAARPRRSCASTRLYSRARPRFVVTRPSATRPYLSAAPTQRLETARALRRRIP